MVIDKIAGSQVLEMGLVQDDHMIEELPTYTANEPFHIGILPR